MAWFCWLQGFTAPEVWRVLNPLVKSAKQEGERVLGWAVRWGNRLQLKPAAVGPNCPGNGQREAKAGLQRLETGLCQGF